MRKRIGGCIIALLLFVAFATRVYLLNSKYPQTKITVVPKGERSEIAKHVDLKVNSVKEYNSKSIKKHVSKSVLKYLDITNSSHFLKVNVDLENNSNKAVDYEVYRINLECMGYSTAHDQILMEEWNDEWGTEMKIPAHGKLNLNLGYNIFIIHKNDSLKKMKSDGLYLVADYYPKKTEWMLF